MAETMRGYPRWAHQFTRTPSLAVIAWHEMRKIYLDRWTGYAFTIFLALAALNFAAFSRLSTTFEQLTDALKILEWGALAVTAIGAGPALLEDKRKGALELYYSRAVTPWQYLTGKSIAVWVLAFAAVFLPTLLYYVSTLITIENLPENWGWMWLGLLGHAAIWATVVTGMGLGLSALLRSARAASLVLFGVVFGLDVLLSNILNAITQDPKMQLLSPIANLHQQNEWLFPGGTAPYAYPAWWGLIVLAGLAVAGWGLVAWRHPRIRGVE